MMKNITKIAFIITLVVTGSAAVSAQQALCGSVSGRSLCTTTNQATNITQTSATISGSVSGASSVTQSWLELNGPGLNCPYVDPSDTSNQTATCRTWALQNGGGSLSYTATFLQCGKTYNFRTVAREGNVIVGDQPWRQFSTLSCGGGVGNDFRIINFTASPSYFSNGGGTTNLSWSSENASSCTISGIGSVNTNGSQSRYVGSTQSFTLSCFGTNGGSDSRSLTVQVENNNYNNPVRIDSFYASPTNVTNGGYTTMYWTTTNASSCSLSGVNVGVNSSRSMGPIYGSQNYTLVCYGVNGGSDSRTIYVSSNGQGETPVISTFNVVARSDNYVNINWSSNADYCIAGGDWSGTKNASGNETVGPFTGTRTFTLTCYRNNQTAVQTQTIFLGGVVQNQNNAAITNIATRIGTSGAQLNGIAVIANGAFSEAWFEYGRTESLGNTTSIRSIGSARTTDFSEVITGLSSNTAYYYRAVMRNNQGTFRGDIERFVTARASVVTVPTPVTPTQTALTFSRPAFMEITVNQVTLDALREGEVEYQVNYRSLTNRTLVNTAIKVLLPEEFEYISATRGVYSVENKTLTLNIGEFRAGEQGTIIVRARVLPLAQIGKTVVVTGYANYTVPADAQFLAYQDEVIAYALTTIREGRFTTAQTGSVAAGFFGTNLGMAFGWLLLLLILLAIIYMLRKLYLSFVEAKKA